LLLRQQLARKAGRITSNKTAVWRFFGGLDIDLRGVTICFPQ